MGRRFWFSVVSLMGSLIFSFLLSSFNHLYANKPSSAMLSAIRPKDVDWRSIAHAKEAMEHNLRLKPTILNSAKPWQDDALEQHQAMFTKIPVWKDYETIKAEFEFIRDHRFIEHPLITDSKENQKTIPWRYPVDFCFERAAAAHLLFTERNVPTPAKVFVFGDLMLLSPYLPEDHSMLTFWYHVALIVRDGKTNQLYVLDPALNFSEPLPLQQFMAQVIGRSEDKEVLINICNSYAFGPMQVCKQASKDEEWAIAQDLKNHLPAESEVLHSKGIDTLPSKTNALQNTIKFYGSIKFNFDGIEVPISDQLKIQYRQISDTSNSDEWKTLLNLTDVHDQMREYDYTDGYKDITIGTDFALPSRSELCQCSYMVCACRLEHPNENKIEMRLMLNDKVMRQCTYEYPHSQNIIDLMSYGPKIHFEFKVSANGKVSSKKIHGGINHCI